MNSHASEKVADAVTGESDVNMTLAEAARLALRVLVQNGLSAPHAEAVARVIVAGQRDACASHGMYRLLSCVQAIRHGKVSPDAVPTIEQRSAAVVVVDAHRGFSPLAFETGTPHLIEKAAKTGVAALVINNCYHFSALWPEVEALAAHGVSALAMTPSHSCVAPAGGRAPVFGTNPIAFAFPRRGRNPYVFDFATSVVARGDIELHRRRGEPIPAGWGITASGEATTSADEVLDGGVMLAFGGHKGSALATMIELLAGPLIGDLTSLESREFDGGAGVTPLHGELILAFDPQVLGGSRDHLSAERLFFAITDQGARLPSERRYAARERSLVEGIRIPAPLYRDLLALL